MESDEWRIQALLVFVVVLFTVTLTAFFLPAISYSQLSPTQPSNNIANTKVVILSFDDNRKGDFTYDKPILDKYGFNATFFIIYGKTVDKRAMHILMMKEQTMLLWSIQLPNIMI